MEARLATHIEQQDRIDETAFCLACGETVYLHDHTTYECVQGGVMHKWCADAQRALAAADNDAEGQSVSDWFDERVANGVDPLEAARDADACCMSFEDWQKHYQHA